MTSNTWPSDLNNWIGAKHLIVLRYIGIFIRAEQNIELIHQNKRCKNIIHKLERRIEDLERRKTEMEHCTMENIRANIKITDTLISNMTINSQV